MTLLNKPMRRPVPLACSATSAALLLLVTGASGYSLNRHDRFVAGSPWADGPIWSQLGIGAVLLLVSGWLWRRAWVALRG